MAARKTGKTEDAKGRKSTGGTRIYATVDELATAIEAYFAKCDEMGILYGEAGLALALGVQLNTLRSWYDGDRCTDFQDTVQMAYLRIQAQVETDPAYAEKAMVSKGIFLLKQKRFGGYQDKIEAKQDIAVNVKMGDGMESSDFQ